MIGPGVAGRGRGGGQCWVLTESGSDRAHARSACFAQTRSENLKDFRIAGTLKGGGLYQTRDAIIHFKAGGERNPGFAVTPTFLLFSLGSIFYSRGQEVELSVRVTFWSWNKIMLTLTKSQLCWRLGGVWPRKWESVIAAATFAPRSSGEQALCVWRTGYQGMQPQRISQSNNGPDLAGQWVSIRPG